MNLAAALPLKVGRRHPFAVVNSNIVGFMENFQCFTRKTERDLMTKCVLQMACQNEVKMNEDRDPLLRAAACCTEKPAVQIDILLVTGSFTNHAPIKTTHEHTKLINLLTFTHSKSVSLFHFLFVLLLTQLVALCLPYTLSLLDIVLRIEMFSTHLLACCHSQYTQMQPLS